MIPGDLPVGLHVVSLNPFRVPLAALVEGGTAELVDAALLVFQIRFRHGWIMVDAAEDSAFVPGSPTFSAATYASIQRALRDACLVVVTHEHHDHVAGVIRSTYSSVVWQHTVLTRAQVQSLRTAPDDPRVQLDSTAASRFIVIGYDRHVPIAPGVVLVRAPGHTPGSQMVYVRLASGAEVILAGDVAWHMSGIATLRQKPDSSTRDFGGEDRATIAAQLRWLKELDAAGVTVLLSHDQAAAVRSVARGVLREGFDARAKR